MKRLLGLIACAAVAAGIALGGGAAVNAEPSPTPTPPPKKPCCHNPTTTIIVQQPPIVVAPVPPLLPLDRQPKGDVTNNTTIINNLPPVAPTVKPQPVHFPLYQPYDYACDCYPGQGGAVEIPPPLTRPAAGVVASVAVPQFKPPATGNGGLR